MIRYLAVLLAGLLLGAAFSYFLFVGAPKAKMPPGTYVKNPDPGGPPPGTAIVVLDDKFFNAFLGKIFQDLGSPSFPLQLASGDMNKSNSGFHFIDVQGGCENKIMLAQEGSGVKTGVVLKDGKITAPLAFNGSYSMLGSCMNFKGWAQTNIQLTFNQEKQSLYGHVNVEGVNLENISPLLSGMVTPVVQGAINQRVNPIEVLRSSQLALSIPVQTIGGTLKAPVKDIRSEIKDNALYLHITYDLIASNQTSTQG
jgi:hypothetical protein